ncbi:MAG: redoxin domain-containing protein [Rhizobacter sp.]
MNPFEIAPPLEISEWINTPHPLTLSVLRGRVVMLHAFQMLCPGCVSHGLPQASKVHEMFGDDDVAVVGLHTVFEHHDVMGPSALKAFIHEYRLRFPIGIDTRGSGHIPLTTQAYALQGTPSLVLIDKRGRVRLNHFGRIEDLALGVLLGQLRVEPSMGDVVTRVATEVGNTTGAPVAGCDDGVCAVR